eukprot:UN29735
MNISELKIGFPDTENEDSLNIFNQLLKTNYVCHTTAAKYFTEIILTKIFMYFVGEKTFELENWLIWTIIQKVPTFYSLHSLVSPVENIKTNGDVKGHRHSKINNFVENHKGMTFYSDVKVVAVGNEKSISSPRRNDENVKMQKAIIESLMSLLLIDLKLQWLIDICQPYLKNENFVLMKVL